MTRIDYVLAVSVALSMSACGGSGEVIDPVEVDAAVEDAAQDSLPICSTRGQPFLGARVTTTVEATGAITFQFTDFSSPPAPIDVAATLDAVDTSTSTLHLGTATGAIDVALGSVDASTLDALPIGAAVLARFDRGLVLTDAGDGSLVFAVLAVHRTRTLDAGPFHFEQRERNCVYAWSPDPTFHCAVGMVRLDVDVHAEGYTATLGIDRPEETVTIGERTFSIAVVESRRMATLEEIHIEHPGYDGVCGVAYPEELAVVIGPGA